MTQRELWAMQGLGAARRGVRTAIALAALALALSGCSRTVTNERFHATDVTGATWGRDFHLSDTNGVPRSLRDYRGKVVMLFFGYTHCPDECPTTLAKMAQAVDRLGPEGARVQGLLVTVDPARDTPAILAKYTVTFHPDFVGLTSDAATIAATAKDFKVFNELEPPDDYGAYEVDHSSGVFVFDAQGRLRLLMGADLQVDAMVHDLRLLLREHNQ